MTKTRNKTTWAVLAALALMLGMSSNAAADPVGSNDTGTFIIRIQPNVDLGVLVDTLGAGWVDAGNLDVTMDLGTTQVLFTGVKLTVVGNFNNQEFALSAVADNTWVLDADEADGVDELQLYALICANQTTAPGSALFLDATYLLDGTPTQAGQSPANEGGNSGQVFEFKTDAGAVYADIDSMAVGTDRRLWLRADTPTTTTTDGQQAFTITVTAKSGLGL